MIFERLRLAICKLLSNQSSSSWKVQSVSLLCCPQNPGGLRRQMGCTPAAACSPSEVLRSQRRDLSEHGASSPSLPLRSTVPRLAKARGCSRGLLPSSLGGTRFWPARCLGWGGDGAAGQATHPFEGAHTPHRGKALPGDSRRPRRRGPVPADERSLSGGNRGEHRHHSSGGLGAEHPSQTPESRDPPAWYRRRPRQEARRGRAARPAGGGRRSRCVRRRSGARSEYVSVPLLLLRLPLCRAALSREGPPPPRSMGSCWLRLAALLALGACPSLEYEGRERKEGGGWGRGAPRSGAAAGGAEGQGERGGGAVFSRQAAARPRPRLGPGQQPEGAAGEPHGAPAALRGRGAGGGGSLFPPRPERFVSSPVFSFPWLVPGRPSAKTQPHPRSGVPDKGAIKTFICFGFKRGVQDGGGPSHFHVGHRICTSTPLSWQTWRGLRKEKTLSLGCLSRSLIVKAGGGRVYVWSASCGVAPAHWH